MTTSKEKVRRPSEELSYLTLDAALATDFFLLGAVSSEESLPELELGMAVSQSDLDLCQVPGLLRNGGQV